MVDYVGWKKLPGQVWEDFKKTPMKTGGTVLFFALVVPGAATVFSLFAADVYFSNISPLFHKPPSCPFSDTQIITQFSDPINDGLDLDGAATLVPAQVDHEGNFQSDPRTSLLLIKDLAWSMTPGTNGTEIYFSDRVPRKEDYVLLQQGRTTEVRAGNRIFALYLNGIRYLPTPTPNWEYIVRITER